MIKPHNFLKLHVNRYVISVIPWRSVLLVEEIGVSEKTTDSKQVTDKPVQIKRYRIQLVINRIRILVVIGTD
jgi:hypothetical protein